MFKLIHKRVPSNAKNDILSGLTVALALVPEAVAFALVAGLNPLVGLLELVIYLFHHPKAAYVIELEDER